MANWRYKIRIKQYLDGDELTPEVIHGVADTIKESRDYSTDIYLQEIVFQLEKAKNVKSFNNSLDDLYDWADAELVWIE